MNPTGRVVVRAVVRLFVCRIASFGIALFSSAYSYAQSSYCAEKQGACSAVGTWSASVAVGAGMRENPIVGQKDLPLVLLPEVHYYGKRFSLENYNLGYLLLDSKHHEFNAVATLSLEHVFFWDVSLGNFVLESSSASFAPTETREGDNEPSTGMDYVSPPQPNLDDLHDRNLAALAGVEYGYFNGAFHIGVQALQDVSNVHDGQELRAALSYNLDMNDNRFNFSGGLLWKSAETLDYYYGIRADEVLDSRLVYSADAGTSYFTRIKWEHRLSDRWSILGYAYHRALSDQTLNSPLVKTSSINTVYLGGVYHF